MSKKTRLKRDEHSQEEEVISSELYFNNNITIERRRNKLEGISNFEHELRLKK